MNNDQKGFALVLEVVLVAIVVGVIGFGVWRIADGNKNNDATRQDDAELVQEAELLAVNLGDIKSLEEIQTIALATTENVTIIGVELEVEDGVTLYAVHLSDGTVLFYNATTGESVAITDDNDDEFEDGESIPIGFVATVSIQEAITIAQTERPNSQLEKVEIELEDGVVVISVRFSDDSRVDVNALTGVVQRLKDETGEDIIKLDDDFDDDGENNNVDDDDDNDGIMDEDDSDDDNDGIDDDEDDDDDNDGLNDDEDDDNSGSGSSNSGNSS